MTNMIKSIHVTDYYYPCEDGPPYAGVFVIVEDQHGIEHEFDCVNIITALTNFLGVDRVSFDRDWAADD